MAAPLLTTKLYLPKPRSDAVARPRLIERMNESLARKLTLIAAPAGFGKTSLASAWLDQCRLPAAWMSLDDGDNDPQRFLMYLIAALQTVEATIGESIQRVLQSPQVPLEALLTVLINDIAALPRQAILVLDDYHVINAGAVNQAVAFFVEHLPVSMHLVIVTREDPALPLARLRARAALTEIRAGDLRFTIDETAQFLGQTMGLDVAGDDIVALENRTEGWIVGLQLAALSLQSQADAAAFIRSFTGNHRFILDYLTEEVLLRQPEAIQSFLLRTSILDRLCGPLCDAVLGDANPQGQAMLEYLEQANLFIIPLDNERRWYRYHHLFAELLRQRLQHYLASLSGSDSALHSAASEWYEQQGLDLEAFHHAVRAKAIARAVRLIEGRGMPLPFRGGAAPVLNWLETLPSAVIDDYPALWVMYASVLLFVGNLSEVESKLQAAEALIDAQSDDDSIRDLVGHIAAIRATLAVSHHQAPTIIAQSQRALRYLRPDNLPVRTATTWALGYAHQLHGDRSAASHAYTEAIAASEAIGHHIITILSTLGLARIQEASLQLPLAVETYQHALNLMGDAPLVIACEAHLGLARIFYEWNDCDASLRHGQIAHSLVRQLQTTDRFVLCDIVLARLKLAQSDVAGAVALLDQAAHAAQHHGFVQCLPEIAEQQVRVALRQGQHAMALQLAQNLPVLVARADLASGNPSEALRRIAAPLQEAETRQWSDERLKCLMIRASAFYQLGDTASAMRDLQTLLQLAAPGGLIRTFLDEGPLMVAMLAEANKLGTAHPYAASLLALWKPSAPSIPTAPTNGLIEPLSQRELEILRLIAQGLSNQEICERLVLSLSTVKGHNRNIFDKLQVQRRTEAVARARELRLL